MESFVEGVGMFFIAIGGIVALLGVAIAHIACSITDEEYKDSIMWYIVGGILMAMVTCAIILGEFE